MPDTNQQSLDLHKSHRGKLEIKSKVPLVSKEDLSLAYTPGVAEVSRQIATDKTKLFEYTNVGNTVAVVSDGSAVLGLGNIGPEAAMPVMEGKAILFKEFGGVDAFPICLATQDTEEIIKIVTALAPSFGGINLEDISAPRCFEIERRLADTLNIPVFHDDQHGTAIVVLAGLINALKLVNKQLSDVKVIITGAGAAGSAIVSLLWAAGMRHYAIIDSQGVICSHRTDLNSAKSELIAKYPTTTNYCSGTCPITSLTEAITGADILIGVSGPNTVSKEMVASMNSDAIVFAMANPTPEIMPDEAKAAGARVVATGRSDFPNQVNNVLAFPGIFRGLFDSRAVKITERMKLAAAEAIAKCVDNPTPEQIIPSPFDRNVATAVAEAVKNAI
ncbi:MAG: NADP-dependent malic enzyme [Candidatus Buchananbacteria bacterium]|nr:NADP-dependent malic enzyme [Candidatus Buchananbacteria bacterium]